MPFDQRLREGLKMGVYEGIDLAFGLPALLVTLAERFGKRAKGQSLRPLLKNPGALARVVKAMVKSKIAGRPLLPKDLWSLRGLAVTGSNVALYREQIKEMWGRDPLDVYGCTEGAALAMQTWDRQGMTFIPYFNFFEFIPEEEHLKARAIPGYKPNTVLLDEVKPGELYEIVISNLMGGPFVRYRLGDLLRITSMRNEKIDIDIPQMEFYSRVSEIIEIGEARITEKAVWQAMKQAEIPYQEWTVRKEEKEDRKAPFLHLYLELKEGTQTDSQDAAYAIHQRLKELEPAYAEMDSALALRPLRVTELPSGAFEEYTEHQKDAGLDLCHLKPPHMSPTDSVLDLLLKRVAQEEEPRLVGSHTG